MYKWEELFQTHILERGRSYFCEGAVKKIWWTENGYKAVVEGTEDYEVEIDIRDDEVEDMYCTCPYAEDGTYCKHMAAVLFEISCDKQKNGKGSSWERRKAEEKEELEEVIAHIPENDLRILVKQIAQKDLELRNHLLVTYSFQMGEKQIRRLEAEVDGIVAQYQDYDGSVDYDEIWEFTSALQDFLGKNVSILMERGFIWPAFEVACYVFEAIANIDFDDMEYEISEVADSCYELWRKALEGSDPGERQKIYQWFIDREASENGYMEEYVGNFLMKEFHDQGFLMRRLAVLDERISKAEQRGDCDRDWDIEYWEYKNNILKRLRIMEELKYPKAQISAYRKKYWKFPEIREQELQERLRMGEVEEAIKILQESKLLDKESSRRVFQYSEQLLGLYEKQSDKEAYKKELVFYVFSGRLRDLRYIKKLKAICTEKEWEKYRERLLGNEAQYNIRYSLMESEGMYEQMLQEIQQEQFIYKLNDYENTLKAHFPEQVRDMYISYVCRMAESVSSRIQYRELIWYLKKIVTYPEGERKAQEIAERWKNLYRRRHAMMDELKKAGF